MLSVALLLVVQDAQSVDTALAEYRRKTRADVPCRAPGDENELVVCASREADEHRVPLVPAYSGKDLPDARVARLVGQRILPECGQGAFMAKCGFVGVTMTVGPGGVRLVRRPLAP